MNQKFNPTLQAVAVKPSAAALSNLKPGEYAAEIVHASHFTHTTGGHDVIAMQLEVNDGQGNVEHLNKYYNITSEGAKEFVENELQKIGIVLHSRDDLIAAPRHLANLKVQVMLKYNDDGYPVVYFAGLQGVPRNKIDPNSFWI